VNEPREKLNAGEPPSLGAGSSRALIVLAVIVAALLRIAWAARHGLAMDQEGVEYARLAENLLAGRGYVGMFNNGTQLNFPPLYPLMIAAVSVLLRSTELAARAVNIGLGAALVIPAFKIAQRLYGQRVAMAVTVLVVFHPLLIAGGASTYAEGPYLTLLMSALLWLMIWADERRVGASIWAGVFFGLAYLVRPEAFVIVGVFVAFGVIASFAARDRKLILLGAVGLAASFSMVAAPNVIFLTRSTGKLRIEAKGTLAYQWGQRINAGMTYAEAVKGIGDDLSEQGVFMRPNIDVISSASYTMREYLAYLFKAARRNIAGIHRAVVDESAFGSPLLYTLVVLGLFTAGWGRRRLVLDGILVATAGMVLTVLLTVQELWLRYFYSLLGIFLIWGGKGADHLSTWAMETAGSLIDRPRARELAGALFKWGAIASVLVVSLRTMPDVSQFKESEWPERVAAGRWLASQTPQHKWVMDNGLQVPYYAGADVIYLPYTTRSDLAVRYIEKRKPDFIVLHSATKADLPYTSQWFDEGIPDTRAVLIYDEQKPQGERIKIYRWADGAR